MEGDIENKVFMGGNDTFLRTNTENFLAVGEVPEKSGRNIADVADIELFCEFGVYCHRAEVYLILDVFEVYAMTTPSNPTKLPNLPIINNFIAQN